MLLDARDIAPGTTLEADVCVAGAGAAGITLALDLRGTGRSVILLESGGFEADPAVQRLYEGEMVGINTWNLHTMRVRALGGTTARWSGMCRPLMPRDFERRDHVPHSGWPIRYEDLVPWYRRACETVQIASSWSWNAADRATATGRPLLPLGGPIEHRYYQFSPPTRFGTLYRGALESARDVRVVLHGNVTDVRLEPGPGRVSSFSCRTLEGRTFHVHAGRYVLALGGIENARLLLASRSQRKEGVANGQGAVGRYFMEHPHYIRSAALVHAARLDRSFFRTEPSDLTDASGRAIPIRGALGLSADIARREGLLNFSATIDMDLPDSPRPGALAPETTQALLTRGGDDFRLARFSVRAEQSPLPESRLVLTDGRDALGMPRVALDWRIAPEDDERMHRALVILARELAAAGLARVWIPGEASRFIWRPRPGGHHLGTTRMGHDPAVSVVDAHCRAHEVDNLYVVGGSVFTTGGDSNPTLTIVALAHRLARTLMEAA